MTEAHNFLSSQASGSFDAEINGAEFTVTRLIDGPAGNNDIEKLYATLNDNSIPLVGSDLSAVSSDLAGCWLRKIDVLAVSNNQVKVTLHYQQSPFGIIRIDAGTQISQVQTNRTIATFGNPDGLPVVLHYIYPLDYGGESPSGEQARLIATGVVKQGGTVSKQISERTRVYTVRENLDPNLLSPLFENKTNEFIWWDGEPGTWLLVSITGSNDNSQRSGVTNWVNTYTFQERIGGWNPEAVYHDDLTGEPVPDPGDIVVFGAGTEAANVIVPSYQFFDFTVLFPGQ